MRNVCDAGRPATTRRGWIPRCVLPGLVFALWALSCAPGFDAVSKVNTLRVIALEVDIPYALPGETVRFSLTVADALEDSPRPLQAVWIGGCTNPNGDQYFLCFDQLAAQFQALGGGGGDAPPDPSLLKPDVITPERSGEPRTSFFDLTIPDDIVTRRPVPEDEEAARYGIAFVFFAVCAGTLRPTELVSLGGEVPEIPLECVDDAGVVQGPDSFTVGYTQVYVFEDERRNASPPIEALTLDGAAVEDLEADADDLPVVARCDVSAEVRRRAGCGEEPVAACTKYELNAVIPDVAEDEPGAVGAEGQQLRETVWVSYLADGGDLDPSLKLVSDASLGFRDDFTTEWTPPATPGVYTIWAVVRDQRGGSDLVRRFVRVE